VELSDLKSTLESLSEEELQKVLINIRQNRRTPRPKAETSSTAKKKSASTSTSEASIDAMIGTMSKDKLAELLSALGGMKK
jgi:hypothetical protein